MQACQQAASESADVITANVAVSINNAAFNLLHLPWKLKVGTGIDVTLKLTTFHYDKFENQDVVRITSLWPSQPFFIKPVDNNILHDILCIQTAKQHVHRQKFDSTVCMTDLMRHKQYKGAKRCITTAFTTVVSSHTEF